MTASENPPRAIRCPICGRDGDDKYRPFCSKRCADIDLGKWFSGQYTIAGRDGDDERDEPSDATPEPHKEDPE